MKGFFRFFLMGLKKHSSLVIKSNRMPLRTKTSSKSANSRAYNILKLVVISAMRFSHILSSHDTRKMVLCSSTLLEMYSFPPYVMIQIKHVGFLCTCDRHKSLPLQYLFSHFIMGVIHKLFCFKIFSLHSWPIAPRDSVVKMEMPLHPKQHLGFTNMLLHIQFGCLITSWECV